MDRINWPNGKRFAFTVFDDTDLTTLQTGPALYGFLYDLGIVTTKSVWPIKGKGVPFFEGATCADSRYLEWVNTLKSQGFEIALHNATFHSSPREDVLRGLEEFKYMFGQYPNVHTNHTHCADAIYWGPERVTGANRLVYNLLTRFNHHGEYLGSAEGSKYFWADRCSEHIKYVRNFVYSDINTLRECPTMPYHDADRPYVNYWFASSEGATCRSFCKTLSEKNQDKLEEQGGACIMYTHFGSSGFHQNEHLEPTFVRLMIRLSQKDGWFVPVSTLLDHIQSQRGPHVITGCERNRLERKWLMQKSLRGTS